MEVVITSNFVLPYPSTNALPGVVCICTNTVRHHIIIHTDRYLYSSPTYADSISCAHRINGIVKMLVIIVVFFVHLYANAVISSLDFFAIIADVFGRKIPVKVPHIIMMNVGVVSIILKSATTFAPSSAKILRIIGLDCVAVI